MGLLEGLILSIGIGGVLGLMVVVSIRDWRIQARRDRNPGHPWIEVLEPGEKPLTDPLMTQQGNCITVLGFGNLWKKPKEAKP